MNHQNLFLTNLRNWILAVSLCLISCKKHTDNFTSAIRCDSAEKFETVSDRLNLYLTKSGGFFTLTENEKGGFNIEPYREGLVYEDKGTTKIGYNNSTNTLLINEEITAMSELDSMISALAIKNISSKTDLASEFHNENSGLVFEITNYSVNDSEMNLDQLYTVFVLLKTLDCSINNVRKTISKNFFGKDFYNLAPKEVQRIRNIVPKIFYVIYLKNHRKAEPVPINP